MNINGKISTAAVIFSLIINCLFLTENSSAQKKSIGGKTKSAKGASRRQPGKKGTDKKPKVFMLDSQTDKTARGPFAGTADAFGVTPPIRDTPEVRGALPPFKGIVKIEGEENNEVKVVQRVAGAVEKPDADLLARNSREAARSLSPTAMPAPILTFNGIASNEIANTLGVLSMPPDTVGDVGPNHHVQAVNLGVFRVYNKTGGALTALARISTLFSGLPEGNRCRTTNNGDPVVNYDPLADRWLISQFVVAGTPRGQCIAVSATGDPTGAWYGYFFQHPNQNFPDYPHWSVWTNGYYLSTHDFDVNSPNSPYVEGSFWAFDREKMLAGDATAGYVRFARAASIGHLPADIDGYMPPAAETPAMFFEFQADEYGETGGDGILSWELAPDFATPANSTFTQKPPLPLAAFDPRTPSDFPPYPTNIIEQPAPALTTEYLDAISGFNMFRVAYRNLGTVAAPVNSYVTNWSVNVSGATPDAAATHQSGIRWTELRRTQAGAVSVFDQGTHAPDAASGAGRNRWLGSIAQDYLGNIALGFSRSGLSAGDFPDIVWAGRTGGQTAAGVLNEGEATMHAGTGIQNSSNNRWGDYSAMTVDPSDDCTFWFTSEWRDAAFNGTANNNHFRWNTRVGNFKFPECAAQPKGQIAANITACDSGLPMLGVKVTAFAGNFSRLTNAAGNLISNIVAAPNVYTVTAAKAGLTPVSTTATVTNGGTTTVNLCLNGPTAATVSVAGRVAAASGRAVAGALVTFTNLQGEVFTARTDQFGRYVLNEMRSGETYVVNVTSKRFRFETRILNLNEESADVNFTAKPQNFARVHPDANQ